MEKKTLRFGTTVKTLMVSLLVVAIGMIHGYSQTFTFGDLNYSVNTNGTTVTLRGHVNGTSASGELTIPETVTNEDVTYIVTAIGNQAF